MNNLTYTLSATELSQLSGEPPDQIVADLEKAHYILEHNGSRIDVPPQAVRSYLNARGVNYDFKVIAHINLKGGVGKTTSSITLASRAAQYGFRTCILDLDSQASASLAFGITLDEDDPVFIDVWQKPDELLMPSLHEIQPGFNLLPSSLENALLDLNLANPTQQKNAVRTVCNSLRDNGFDLVFIDCPPSLGAAVISSACAADMIVVPVGYDVFSQKGLTLSVSEISAICDTFGLNMPKLHILYTFFDRRVKQSMSTFERLREQYGDQLIPVPMRTTTRFAKAGNTQNTVFAAGAKHNAKHDYDACLRHLLQLDAPFARTGEKNG